ncbi:MAG TPA: hypothetical protein VFB58_00530 [Chloroflexota bacterium]|nr:hypothetical protein [Chloroflexota bacterium]
MEIPERTVRFEAPGVDIARDAADLANALTALSGVVHVAVRGNTVTVSFDEHYVNAQMICQNAEAAGYSVREQSSD